MENMNVWEKDAQNTTSNGGSESNRSASNRSAANRSASNRSAANRSESNRSAANRSETNRSATNNNSDSVNNRKAGDTGELGGKIQMSNNNVLDGGVQITEKESVGQGTIREVKKIYNKIGWKYCFFMLVVIITQLIMPLVAMVIGGPDAVNQEWYMWISLIVPIYLVAFPVLVLLVRRTPKSKPVAHKMKISSLVCCVLMGSAISLVGQMVGNLVNGLVMKCFSLEGGSALEMLMTGNTPIYQLLVVGICAPIFEELIFRKLLVDRIGQYGEFNAILISGLLFGLFHGNFTQFFYAFGLGMFWAYIYARTGKIWYTILFHMIINTASCLASIFITPNLPAESMQKLSEMNPFSAETLEYTIELLPQISSYVIWTIGVFVAAIIGLVIWIVSRKKFFLKKQPLEMEGKGKLRVALLSGGMIAFALVSVLLFVFAYAAMA